MRIYRHQIGASVRAGEVAYRSMMLKKSRHEGKNVKRNIDFQTGAAGEPGSAGRVFIFIAQKYGEFSVFSEAGSAHWHIDIARFYLLI